MHVDNDYICYFYQDVAHLAGAGASGDGGTLQRKPRTVSTPLLRPPPTEYWISVLAVLASAANRLIGEVVQSRKRPLLGPSPG